VGAWTSRTCARRRGLVEVIDRSQGVDCALLSITFSALNTSSAGCDRENRVALANLAVGVEHAEQVEDGVVPLPECPTCRSREFLVRSPASEQAHPSQGSSGHLHQLIVDELHSQLVKKGRVVERLVGKAEQIVTRPIATEVRARFFDKGLKLPARAVEELQGKEPVQ
jgi:hypothetical protein